MTNNIVNCCENASSALPNDNAGDHHHQQQQHQKASMNRNQQQQQQQHPNNHLPNGNTMNSAQQPNHTQHQSNEHLVQTYPNHHHHHHHHLDEKRNDDNFDSRSPYQSTTIANDNNMKTKSPFSSSLVQPTSFSSSSSSSSSSSPPPPYHNDVDDDDDDDDGLRRPKHFNRMSCPDSDSFWNKIHMILVVVASATINGVVFGVVNNFGVFYAHLTEMAAKDPSVLGLNYHGADVDFSPPPPLSSSSTSSSSSSSRINNSYANDNTILNKTIDSSVTNSDALAQSLIAGVGSFNVGLIFFCSIFASVLSDRYDIRKVCLFGGILATIGMYASSVSLNLIYLYITYGLVMGIGASLVYGPSLAILGHYFTKRLGLVNGLVTAGSSAFSIVMPFVLRWLLDKVDIQVTFKYLSILMATLILCSSSFKEQIKRPNKQKHGSAKKNLANMFFYDALWKNNLYLYWVISIPVGLFGYFVPFCHLYKHARDINSYYQGEVLVMSIGVTSMLGRLITGPLADVSRVNRICLQQIAFATIGLLTMCLPFVNDLSLLMVCCGLGLFDGCFISLLGPIAFDLVGPEYANQAIGLLLCFCSLPLTTGPPIAAYSYGIYGDYKLAFVLAGIPPIVAALLMFNIIRMQRMQRRRTSTVKLGIDEPRCLFDEVMIGDCCSNNSGNNGGMEANGKQSQQSRLENSLINGEKLHLLITGNEPNHPNHHKQHPQHAKGINGTTKLTLSPPSSSCNDTDSNSNTIEDSLNGFNDEDDTIQNHPNDNEKTGLLFNDGDGGNNIVILSKDHHQPQQQQQPQPQSQNNSSSANNNDDNSQSLQSSIRA